MPHIASVGNVVAGTLTTLNTTGQPPATKVQSIAAFKTEQALEAQKGVRDGDEPVGAAVNTYA